MRKMRTAKQALAILLSVSMLFCESIGVSATTIDSVAESTAEEVVVEDTIEEQEEANETVDNESEDISDESQVSDEDETIDEDDENVESEDTEEVNEDLEGEESESGETEEIEAASEEVTEISEEQLIGGLFPGLESGYELSSTQKEIKEDIVDNMKMDNYVAGMDYPANEIVVLAEDEDKAEEYAKAFNGSLSSYSYGVAVIELNKDDSYKTATVYDAVKLSSDERNMLPPATPNFYRYLDSEFDEVLVDKIEEIAEEEAAETETVEETVVDETESVEEAEEDVVYYDEAGNAVSVGPEVNYTDDTDAMRKANNDKFQWHHGLVGSDLAWQAGYNGKGVKLGVIDTGLITGHQDMDYDTIHISNMSSSSSDIDGHGSNVAGIIKAKLNNKVGGAGIANGVELYVYNVNQSNKELNSDAIMKAVNKAVADGVEILNLSLGGPHYDANEAVVFANAYEAGIAIFVAAGNEGTTAIAYPAGYTGCISVGAVNRANRKTEFSNFGGVFFSGPGEDIYSISNASTSSYGVMSGTSQATPCVAAIAAVVLAASKSNPKLFPDIASHSGKAKVSCLKNALARGVIASGLGRGTPHLGKILKLGTTDTAPNAPAASTPTGIVYSDSLDVKLSAPGCTIYYTTDGTNITYKNGVISSNAKTYEGTITIKGNSRIFLKTLAVNSANMLASRMATFTYTFRPSVTGVTVTSKTNVYNVVRGGSLAMVANVSPAYAYNKAVTWSVVNNPVGVTITATGLLRVAANSTVTSVNVKATSKDNAAKYQTKTVYIKSPDTAIASIVPSKRTVTVYNGKYENITLTATKKDRSAVTLTTSNTVVSSSNSAVATAKLVSNNTLQITGVGAGRATISVYANDGSGKVVNITVVGAKYVTGVTISGPTNSTLATGKSMKLVASVNSDASNKRLTWSITSIPSGASISTCGVKVAAGSGVVSATANAVIGSYTVKAAANDGSNKYGTYTFKVTNDKINTLTVGSTAERLIRVNWDGSAVTSYKSIPITIKGGSISNVEVTCNAPGIVDAYRSGNNVYIKATGKAIGSAVVTVASTDGTNLRKTIRVTVANPASALRIAASPGRSKYLAHNRTMALMTSFETNNGSIDGIAKKLVWSSNNESVISVNPATGQVKANAASGSATITAKTTDGSGVSSSIVINACCAFNGFYEGLYSFDRVDWGSNRRYGKMIVPLGETAYIRAIPKYVDSLGTFSRDFTYKVSRAGLGLKPIYLDKTYFSAEAVVVGNKRGKYKIIITSSDGSPGTCVLAVTVE